MTDRDDNEPIHTNIKSDPISTPGYWRLFTTWIMMRYGTRVGVDLIKKKALDERSYKEESKKDFIKIRDAFREGTEDGNAYVTGEIKELKSLKEPEFDGPNILHEEEIAKVKGAYRVIRETKADKASMVSRHTPGTIEEARDVVNDFESSIERGLKKEGNNKVKKVDAIWDRRHDSINGALNMTGTFIYASRVASDIRSVFAEAVAYEHDKKPGDVTLSDMVHSDNKLVNTAIKNYVKYNSVRLASDMAFFVRSIGPAVGLPRLSKANGTDLGMAVKGALLSFDILGKQTTFFEDTVRLIDNKLNPVSGLGDQVAASDIVDLYQKYAIDHKKAGAFKRGALTEIADNLNWKRGEGIFNRIAELMNGTYRYKNTAENSTVENFALPKFLYLLGHDMIDLTKPEQTMAFVEVANKHGIPAVKQMDAALKSGISLDDCLKQFPVELHDSTTHQSHTQRIAAENTAGKSMAERIQASQATLQPRSV